MRFNEKILTLSLNFDAIGIMTRRLSHAKLWKLVKIACTVTKIPQHFKNIFFCSCSV